MPYTDDSTHNLSREACVRYSISYPERRQRFVYAREHGLTCEQAARYTNSLAPSDFPSYDWEPNEYPPDGTYECECGDCDECGYSEPDNEFPIDETSLSSALRIVPFAPLARILRRGGRYWSAEVEINGLSPVGAARAIGCDQESYGTKLRDAGTIVATDDCTCHAEIKIGRMRDGATMTARALAAYDSLREHGAGCGYNTGHHVHVDATRVVDLGAEAVDTVLTASLTLASACEPTLKALASTGYATHRDTHGDGYAGSLKDSKNSALSQRTAWHASNAHYVAQYGPEGGAISTFEYRLPNGTTEPIRAHAHIAVALGLLDFGERVLDREPDALETLRRAQDRIAHAQDWSMADGAAILTRALTLHPNSLACLSIAAQTAPTDKQTRDVLALAAS